MRESYRSPNIEKVILLLRSFSGLMTTLRLSHNVLVLSTAINVKTLSIIHKCKILDTKTKCSVVILREGVGLLFGEVLVTNMKMRSGAKCYRAPVGTRRVKTCHS